MPTLEPTCVTAASGPANFDPRDRALELCETASLSITAPDNQRMVQSYVAALCRDPGAVDDLAQEVFVRALERIDRLHDPADAGAFLRGIARHVVQEHFRRRRRDRSYLDATIAAIAEDEAPWRSAQNEEALRRLHDAIDELPVVARRMLEMRYHDGRTAVEIARAFGIRPGAVRASLM